MSQHTQNADRAIKSVSTPTDTETRVSTLSYAKPTDTETRVSTLSYAKNPATNEQFTTYARNRNRTNEHTNTYAPKTLSPKDQERFAAIESNFTVNTISQVAMTVNIVDKNDL